MSAIHKSLNFQQSASTLVMEENHSLHLFLSMFLERHGLWMLSDFADEAETDLTYQAVGQGLIRELGGGGYELGSTFRLTPAGYDFLGAKQPVTWLDRVRSLFSRLLELRSTPGDLRASSLLSADERCQDFKITTGH